MDQLAEIENPSDGIYLRDLSEIRAGVNSYDFQHTKYPPDSPHYCLCLIGSERTISLEMPDKVVVVIVLLHVYMILTF